MASKKARFWSKKDLDILKKYYPTRGPDAVAKMVGRTASSVNKQASTKKIEFKGTAPATVDSNDATEGLSEDEQKLMKFVAVKPKTLTEISEHVDRSIPSIEKMVDGLKEKHYKNLQVREDTQSVALLKEAPMGERKIIDVKKYFGGSREVTFGIISDLHYCNVHSREELIPLMYDIFKKEGVSIVFEGGNMIDGEAFFNTRELKAWGIENQVQYLIEHAPKVDGVTTYFVTGDDHEGWMARKAGVIIGELIESRMKEAGREDWQYLSHMEADVCFKTEEGETVVRVSHPGMGVSYALSYTPQKIIESLSGGEKPHVLLLGHYHKAMYASIRNVHAMLMGTFEQQTPFMRKKHIEAHIGGWVVRMTLAKDGTVQRFCPEWFPFLDRKVYQVNRDYPIMTRELPETKEGKPAKIF